MYDSGREMVNIQRRILIGSDQNDFPAVWLKTSSVGKICAESYEKKVVEIWFNHEHPFRCSQMQMPRAA